jgi:hypothetical protein
MNVPRSPSEDASRRAGAALHQAAGDVAAPPERRRPRRRRHRAFPVVLADVNAQTYLTPRPTSLRAWSFRAHDCCGGHVPVMSPRPSNPAVEPTSQRNHYPRAGGVSSSAARLGTRPTSNIASAACGAPACARPAHRDRKLQSRALSMAFEHGRFRAIRTGCAQSPEIGTTAPSTVSRLIAEIGPGLSNWTPDCRYTALANNAICREVESGRQDLNLRPPGPQPEGSGCVEGHSAA